PISISIPIPLPSHCLSAKPISISIPIPLPSHSLSAKPISISIPIPLPSHCLSAKPISIPIPIPLPSHCLSAKPISISIPIPLPSHCLSAKPISISIPIPLPSHSLSAKPISIPIPLPSHSLSTKPQPTLPKSSPSLPTFSEPHPHPTHTFPTQPISIPIPLPSHCLSAKPQPTLPKSSPSLPTFSEPHPHPTHTFPTQPISIPIPLPSHSLSAKPISISIPIPLPLPSHCLSAKPISIPIPLPSHCLSAKPQPTLPKSSPSLPTFSEPHPHPTHTFPTQPISIPIPLPSHSLSAKPISISIPIPLPSHCLSAKPQPTLPKSSPSLPTFSEPHPHPTHTFPTQPISIPIPLPSHSLSAKPISISIPIPLPSHCLSAKPISISIPIPLPSHSLSAKPISISIPIPLPSHCLSAKPISISIPIPLPSHSLSAKPISISIPIPLPLPSHCLSAKPISISIPIPLPSHSLSAKPISISIPIPLPSHCLSAKPISISIPIPLPSHSLSAKPISISIPIPLPLPSHCLSAKPISISIPIPLPLPSHCLSAKPISISIPIPLPSHCLSAKPISISIPIPLPSHSLSAKPISISIPIPLPLPSHCLSAKPISISIPIPLPSHSLSAKPQPTLPKSPPSLPTFSEPHPHPTHTFPTQPISISIPLPSHSLSAKASLAQTFTLGSDQHPYSVSLSFASQSIVIPQSVVTVAPTSASISEPTQPRAPEPYSSKPVSGPSFTLTFSSYPTSWPTSTHAIKPSEPTSNAIPSFHSSNSTTPPFTPVTLTSSTVPKRSITRSQSSQTESAKPFTIPTFATATKPESTTTIPTFAPPKPNPTNPTATPGQARHLAQTPQLKTTSSPSSHTSQSKPKLITIASSQPRSSQPRPSSSQTSRTHRLTITISSSARTILIPPSWPTDRIFPIEPATPRGWGSKPTIDLSTETLPRPDASTPTTIPSRLDDPIPNVTERARLATAVALSSQPLSCVRIRAASNSCASQPARQPTSRALPSPLTFKSSHGQPSGPRRIPAYRSNHPFIVTPQPHPTATTTADAQPAILEQLSTHTTAALTTIFTPITRSLKPSPTHVLLQRYASKTSSNPPTQATATNVKPVDTTKLTTAIARPTVSFEPVQRSTCASPFPLSFQPFAHNPVHPQPQLITASTSANISGSHLARPADARWQQSHNAYPTAAAACHPFTNAAEVDRPSITQPHCPTATTNTRVSAADPSLKPFDLLLGKAAHASTAQEPTTTSVANKSILLCLPSKSVCTPPHSLLTTTVPINALSTITLNIPSAAQPSSELLINKTIDTNRNSPHSSSVPVSTKSQPASPQHSAHVTIPKSPKPFDADGHVQTSQPISVHTAKQTTGDCTHSKCQHASREWVRGDLL
ncbi:MAG: hypothetical protein WDW36_010225, partial [Sanguina aurantia]